MMDRERSKNIHAIITINTVLEKILTERSARGEEETKALAISQNEFESWN